MVYLVSNEPIEVVDNSYGYTMKKKYYLRNNRYNLIHFSRATKKIRPIFDQSKVEIGLYIECLEIYIVIWNFNDARSRWYVLEYPSR